MSLSPKVLRIDECRRAVEKAWRQEQLFNRAAIKAHQKKLRASRDYCEAILAAGLAKPNPILVGDEPLVLRGCAGCGGAFTLPYPQPVEHAGTLEPFWCAKCLERRRA